MRKLSILLALVAGLFISPAYADFTAKDASAATITFKNPGVCSSVVCVPVFQIYDGTNVVTLTTAGADAVSNTLTGQPVYGRNLVFNGTTWDRWQGGVSLASGKVASGAFASGSIGSGAMVDLGAQADAAAAADNSTASLIALLKRTNQNLTTQTAAINAPIPAGTNLIGDVNVRQGGTALSATNPSFARLTDGTNPQILDPCETATKVYTPINIVTATSTVVSTGVAAKKKYICALMLYPGAADNVAIIQATTATACVTAPVGLIGGATAATGIIATAQAGFVIGTGAKAVAATTVNQTDICLITSAAVQLSGVLITVDQ